MSHHSSDGEYLIGQPAFAKDKIKGRMLFALTYDLLLGSTTMVEFKNVFC